MAILYESARAYANNEDRQEFVDCVVESIEELQGKLDDIMQEVRELRANLHTNCICKRQMKL